MNLLITRLGAFPLLLVLAVALGASGCAAEPNARVILLNNQDVVALDADDIVLLMTRAGLSSEDILDVGTDLRNGLASAGAAQVHAGRKVEAIFVVEGNFVRGASRTRGAFVYDTEKRTFR